ncbi:hypothetical protein Tco_1438291 [Tanacetum coccineum]
MPSNLVEHGNKMEGNQQLPSKRLDETFFKQGERFKEILMKCCQHYLTEMQEVILFCNGLDVPTRQILDSRGAIPTMTAADAKKAIQECRIKNSSKCIMEISRGRINETLLKERGQECINPLALGCYCSNNARSLIQTPKHHKSNAPTSKASLPTRSHAATRYKGKEIAKPITPPSESASEEDSDPEQAQKDKDMQKNLALIAKYFKKLYKPTNNNLRTSSNTRNKNVDTTPRYKNDNQTGQFGNQRAINVVGARETIGSPVVQQSGI